LGAVYFGRNLQSRRRVGFFVDRDQKPGAAILLDLRVAGGVELADAGEASEELVERFGVERFADQRAQRVLEVLGGVRLGALDADESRDADGGLFAGLAIGEVSLPVGIVQRKRSEYRAFLLRGGAAFFNDRSGFLVFQGSEIVQVHLNDEVGSGEAANL